MERESTSSFAACFSAWSASDIGTAPSPEPLASTGLSSSPYMHAASRHPPLGSKQRGMIRRVCGSQLIGERFSALHQSRGSLTVDRMFAASASISASLFFKAFTS
eukprot:360993-Chlamydomonas_euryale.AAC.6